MCSSVPLWWCVFWSPLQLVGDRVDLLLESRRVDLARFIVNNRLVLGPADAMRCVTAFAPPQHLPCALLAMHARTCALPSLHWVATLPMHLCWLSQVLPLHADDPGHGGTAGAG
jgi:hypothetical protein